MTAAQKKNRERFKKAAAEAKKLRKKNPSLTQAEAVKQAWAIMYKKSGTSKKIGYSKERSSIEKRATPYIKLYKGKGWSKKDAVKNGIIDAAYMSGTKKRKPTERNILNKIHKVKHDVEKLDEAQHDHMSIGAIKSKGVKTLQKKFGILAAKKLMKKKKSEAKKLQKEMTKVKVQLKKLLSL
jgi:hypothetical protein